MVRSPLRYIARKRILTIFFNPVLFGLSCWKIPTSALFAVEAQTIDESSRAFLYANFSTGLYKTKLPHFVLGRIYESAADAKSKFRS
jgi:hypothetical protein